MKICHLTSVHPSNDTRIYYKECFSLSNKYSEITLIAPDTDQKMENDLIEFVRVKKRHNRFGRIFLTAYEVYQKARKLNADIYHLHDPELIFYGWRLKKKGKKVIFDVHENIGEQIKNKMWLYKWLRLFLAKIFVLFDRFIANNFPLILAEHSYVPIYERYTKNYEIVLNMPILSILNNYVIDLRDSKELFYIGGISEIRGFRIILDAINILDKRGIDVVMNFVGEAEENLIKSVPDHLVSKIVFHGRKDMKEGYMISMQSMIGLAVLLPVGNYLTSYSTKVFEYMAIKMPVITSDFPLYKDIVEKHDAGICINPNDPKELADVIQHLFDKPDLCQRLGVNGHKAVHNQYNWSVEERKLINFYEKIINE